ncbi:MAG: histidine kinase [Nocardioides sp.]|uniref:histidine kinase n=1 Tax=Nocardioides sp. TaxID=35761 RepID=UPI003263858D
MERGRLVLVEGGRFAAGLVVVLVGIASYAVATGAGRYASYAGRSDAAAALMLATGMAVVVAGLVSSWGRHHAGAGDLTLLVGLSWFASPLIGWSEGPPAARSGALLISLFTVPLLLHVVVAIAPRRRPLEQSVVMVGYAGAVAVGVVVTLFRDPYFDPTCFANCSVNPFLVHSWPDLVHAIEVAWQWFLAALGVLTVALGAMRLGVGARVARRRSAPIAAPVMVLGTVVVVRALVSLKRPVEDPFDDVLQAAYVAFSASLIVLALGLVFSAVLGEGRRRSLARLAIDLAAVPEAGALEAALGEAVGDDALRVGYRIGETGALVDASGRAVAEPRAHGGRHATTLTHDGSPIAVIDHACPVSQLEEHLGASVRLGLENERLQAEVLARFEELRASQVRIVEAGDRERQRLERDLHDGAQQRLLALSYDIRVASATAVAEGDTLTATTLREATEITQEVLQDLRELARGIFPAALVQLGLAAALRTFAELAPLPVRVTFADPDVRCPGPVESAAYFGVLEAVQVARQRRATRVLVTAHHDQRCLVVVVKDDGPVRTSIPSSVVDRVGALGGTVTAGPTTCRMEIPCA